MKRVKCVTEPLDKNKKNAAHKKPYTGERRISSPTPPNLDSSARSGRQSRVSMAVEMSMDAKIHAPMCISP